MNTLKNNVRLTGRLGQTPELKTTSAPNALAYVKVSLATSEPYKNKEGEWVDNTQWHNLIIWGKTAERFVKNTAKGIELSIEGRLRNSSYEVNNEKRYSTDVEVQDFYISANRVAETTEEANSAKK